MWTGHGRPEGWAISCSSSGGHNDGARSTRTAPAVLSPPGRGVAEFTMPNGKQEVVPHLRLVCAQVHRDIRARAPTPIVLTLTVRTSGRRQVERVRAITAVVREIAKAEESLWWMSPSGCRTAMKRWAWKKSKDLPRRITLTTSGWVPTWWRRSWSPSQGSQTSPLVAFLRPRDKLSSLTPHGPNADARACQPLRICF